MRLANSTKSFAIFQRVRMKRIASKAYGWFHFSKRNKKLKISSRWGKGIIKYSLGQSVSSFLIFRFYYCLPIVMSSSNCPTSINDFSFGIWQRIFLERLTNKWRVIFNAGADDKSVRRLFNVFIRNTIIIITRTWRPERTNQLFSYSQTAHCIRLPFSWFNLCTNEYEIIYSHQFLLSYFESRAFFFSPPRCLTDVPVSTFWLYFFSLQFYLFPLLPFSHSFSFCLNLASALT